MTIFICVCFSYENVHYIRASLVHGYLSAIFIHEWQHLAKSWLCKTHIFYKKEEKKENKKEDWSFMLQFKKYL